MANNGARVGQLSSGQAQTQSINELLANNGQSVGMGQGQGQKGMNSSLKENSLGNNNPENGQSVY